MNRVFLSIGSNIDKEKNIASCVTALRRVFSPLTLSSVYQSAAVGFNGGDFYNLAASFETAMPPLAIEKILRRIEKEHGRVRGASRFVSRQLDLDQILHGDLVIERPLLLPVLCYSPFLSPFVNFKEKHCLNPHFDMMCGYELIAGVFSYWHTFTTSLKSLLLLLNSLLLSLFVWRTNVLLVCVILTPVVPVLLSLCCCPCVVVSVLLFLCCCC